MKKMTKNNTEPTVRINRYLALKKYCSRRQADRFIESGFVQINGKRAHLGDRVGEKDEVTVARGVLERKEDHLYLACYKPLGVVSHNPKSKEEDLHRALAFPLKWEKKGLAPLGRLDKNSEGLMILSDDGRIVHSLLHPQSDHTKEYLVEVDKKILPGHLRQMEKGVNIEGYLTKPAETEKTARSTFQIILREGKKHQIRRMCAALGYQVQSLKRVRIKNITLQKLQPGEYREIVGAEREEFLRGLLG